MSETEYPKRATLEGLVGEIFRLVSRVATPEQWAEWRRVPLEHSASAGNIDLFDALIGAVGRTVVRDGEVVEAAPCSMLLLNVETPRLSLAWLLMVLGRT